MADFELVTRLGQMTEEQDEDLLLTYLDIAGERICRTAYPFDPSVTDVPPQYQKLQLEIASYLINKRGAEGETTHNENGVNRTYASASIPAAMLKSVVPKVGVPK